MYRIVAIQPFGCNTTINFISTVADRHTLAAHHNKHCWQTFRGYQHRWCWMTLKSKIAALQCWMNFSWFEAATHIQRVNFRRNYWR